MLIIDRIEEDTAVLENTNSADGTVTMQKLPLAWLPETVREGDVLCKTKEGYVIDTVKTEKRRAEALALFRDLKED